MPKKEPDIILTCACTTDIVVEKEAGGFALLLKALLHLQGPPHFMGQPIHKKSTCAEESFSDRYNQGHTVIMQKNK